MNDDVAIALLLGPKDRPTCSDGPRSHSTSKENSVVGVVYICQAAGAVALRVAWSTAIALPSDRLTRSPSRYSLNRDGYVPRHETRLGWACSPFPIPQSKHRNQSAYRAFRGLRRACTAAKAVLILVASLRDVLRWAVG